MKRFHPRDLECMRLALMENRPDLLQRLPWSEWRGWVDLRPIGRRKRLDGERRRTDRLHYFRGVRSLCGRRSLDEPGLSPELVPTGGLARLRALEQCGNCDRVLSRLRRRGDLP